MEFVKKSTLGFNVIKKFLPDVLGRDSLSSVVLSVSVLELEGVSFNGEVLSNFLGENDFDFLLCVHFILILLAGGCTGILLVDGCGCASLFGEIISF